MAAAPKPPARNGGNMKSTGRAYGAPPPDSGDDLSQPAWGEENPFANDVPDFSDGPLRSMPENEVSAHQNLGAPVKNAGGAHNALAETQESYTPAAVEKSAPEPEATSVAAVSPATPTSAAGTSEPEKPTAEKSPPKRVYVNPREEWGAVYPDEEEDEPVAEDGQGDQSVADLLAAPVTEPKPEATTPETEHQTSTTSAHQTTDTPTHRRTDALANRRPGSRNLLITMKRTGDINRDKYRLREIYDVVRDPRGRGKDSFFIRLDGAGSGAELSFPNDRCEINDQLLNVLQKRMRLAIEVEGPFKG